MLFSLDLPSSAVRFLTAVFCLSLCLCIGLNSPLSGEVCGKIDVGPAYLHVDVLESNRTVKKMDMIAFRADSTLVFYKGLCLKPMVLAGTGDGDIFNGSLGLGFCIPVYSQIILTPSIGLSYTYLRTFIDLHHLNLRHARERFESCAPYIALEACWSFWECWRICGVIQYSWARTHTSIENLVHNRGHSEGPSYALMIERDLNCHWSINLAAAYNLSLSREKHGIRGYGAKLGIAYWF